jgi:hypothetical protein
MIGQSEIPITIYFRRKGSESCYADLTKTSQNEKISA